MNEKIISKYTKCPQCGETKGLFITKSFTTTKFISLSGKPFVFETEHKRNYKISNEDLAMIMEISEENDDEPIYEFHCDICEWYSHPFNNLGEDVLMEDLLA